MNETQRINKYLSTHGYCSRREADRLVKQGKVFINDEQARLGDTVGPKDEVRVLGRDKKYRPRKAYILLHKPVGVSTSLNRKHGTNVLDLVDLPERVFPVGRLSSYSSGLVILTNDGVLSNRLTNPRIGYEKEYVVEIDRPISTLDIGKLQGGFELNGTRTQETKVRLLEPTRFAIILHGGQSRLINQMCESLGYEVVSIMRTRIGTLKMPTTYPIGNYRHLAEKEVRDLKKLVGLDPDKRG